MFSSNKIDQSSKNSSHNNKIDEEEKFNTDSAIDCGYNSAELTHSQYEDEQEPESAPIEPQNPEPEFKQQTFDSGKLERAPVITFDSGVIDDIEESSSSMLIENNIDVGLSDRLANLRLINPKQQINDLDSKKVQNKLPAKVQQQPQQQEPWEIYYQQNADGDTQLHIAVVHGMVKVVSALVKFAVHPCLLDIQNDMFQTALHLAVLTGQPHIVRILVVNGANLSARDRSGNTPLHLACLNGELECAQQLLLPLNAQEAQEHSRFATPFRPQNLEQWNYDGETCVHLACKSKQLEILKYLVQFGADVNAREGKSGWTALHFAIEQNNEAIANFILESPKINVECMTYAGLTPYQLAVLMENNSLLDDLLKRGAEPFGPPEDSEDETTDDEDMMDQYLLKNYNSNSNKIIA
jgi:NF-kappa-B inhibitor alpha